MEKKCDNCVNDNIGCDVIKKMRSDISKLRRINWSSLLIGLLIGGFIALAIIVVWANFCSRTENNNTPVNVQLKVKEIKDLAKTDKDAIDKVLHTTAEKAFYQGRKDAQNEFDKNFTTLLTILTIFGIAWPVIMTFLQHKSNEKEFKMLEERFTEITDKKIQLLKNKTTTSVDNLAKDLYIKQGGIMAQIAGQIHETSDIIYCDLVAFIFFYLGQSFTALAALKCLQDAFKELEYWSCEDKKKQIVETIKTFLATNKIDPQVRKIIEELQEKAIKTEVKVQQNNQ